MIWPTGKVPGCQFTGTGGGKTTPLLTQRVLTPLQRMADMPDCQRTTFSFAPTVLTFLQHDAEGGVSSEMV